jgi:hypothetical protein
MQVERAFVEFLNDEKLNKRAGLSSRANKLSQVLLCETDSVLAEY